jgi:hypothetical protein
VVRIVSGKSWIGVDFDATLAHYESGNFKAGVLGEPILPMLERVKRWLRKGQTVKIVTARALDPAQALQIADWTERWVGQRLQVTAHKDSRMICLYDDRCRQVIPNTGDLVGEEHTGDE